MPTHEVLRGLHREMVRARVFEETIQKVYFEGKTPAFDIAAGPVPGEMHLAAGQEPVAAGVCAHLRSTDAITATHRPHHIALAHGMDMRKLAAEIFGKETGLGHGKGGHMHLFDAEPAFGCQRDRRRGHPDRGGPRAGVQEAGPRRHRSVILRRGCRQPGGVPRVAQPRRTVGLARRVRLRGQRVGDQRAQVEGHGDRQQQRSCRRLRHPGGAGRGQRPGCGLRGCRRGRRPRPSRWRAVPDRGEDRPACSATSRATRSSTAPTSRSRSWRPRDAIRRFEQRARDRIGVVDRAGHRRRVGSPAAPRSTTPIEFARDAARIRIRRQRSTTSSPDTEEQWHRSPRPSAC